MSAAFRIIPRLDIKGPNLVKGINLEGLRVLGKPEDFAKSYYENGADELIYQDVVASLYGRNSLREMIAKTAKEIFIPLTVGGGIKSLEDIYYYEGKFRAGFPHSEDKTKLYGTNIIGTFELGELAESVKKLSDGSTQKIARPNY